MIRSFPLSNLQEQAIENFTSDYKSLIKAFSMVTFLPLFYKNLSYMQHCSFLFLNL